MQRPESVQQNNIIIHWNLIVDALNHAGIDHQIKKLDPAGTCTGLTYGYKLYSEQNQRTEYVRALMFIARLRGKKEIDELIKQYQAAKINKANFTIPIGKDTLSFDKLIALLEGVQFGQDDQNLSQLRIMWDKTYSFNCHKDQLADYLASAQLKEGESVFVTMFIHKFYVEKAASGYYLFDPNVIGEEAISPELLNTEKELAQQIYHNLSPLMTNNNNLALSMQFVSYGRKSNRALDDAVTEWGDALNNYPHIKRYIKQYNQKKISRLDCGLMINAMLQQEINPSDKLKQFHAAIANYIQGEQTFIDQQFSYNKKNINNKAFTINISLLYFAIRMNQVMLVKQLIQDGVKVNVVAGSNQVTPLRIASQNGYNDIVKLLIQAGANDNPSQASRVPHKNDTFFSPPANTGTTKSTSEHKKNDLSFPASLIDATKKMIRGC